MPEIICRKCGRKTNTAVSNHINSLDEKANECYAAFDDLIGWTHGCSYDKTPLYMKNIVDKLIKKGVGKMSSITPE